MNKAEAFEEQRKKVLAECYADPTLFCRTFLPDWFPKPMSWVHRGVLAILLHKVDFLLNFGEERWGSEVYYYGERDLNKILKHFVWKPNEDAEPVPLFRLEDGKLHLMTANRIQIRLPRGFGKTTVTNAAQLYKILYKTTKFPVYLSETGPHAEEQLGNIKRELDGGNEQITAVFGNIKPERNDPQKWREDYIETKTGVVVMAKGRGGQVRGKNIRSVRPTDIVIDDVEDKESVASDTQLKKTRTWYKADVEPALNQVGDGGNIVMLGTLLGSGALLDVMSKDPEWITISFGAIDPDGEPIWDYYMTIPEFEKKKASYARLGMLVDFYLEYMNKLTAGEDSKFPQQFTYSILTRTNFAGVALVCDPAISGDPDAAYCAFAVTGMTDGGRHHVLDVTGEIGMHPGEQVDEYFRLHFKWEPTKHGIEAIAYQQALIHLMQEEMFRRAKTFGSKAYFEIEAIRHGKQAKVRRVEGILAPRYKAGYITHQAVFPLLESQLFEWPSGKKDFPDVVAMAVAMLDPYAGYAFQPEDNDNDEDALARDQFEPLEVNWSCP